MARASRYDLGTTRKIERTPLGGLRVEAAVSRTGILEYSDGKSTWREYRPPTEVFSEDSLRSLRGAPVTIDHPPALIHSANYRQYAVGHASDAVRAEGERFVVTDLVIQDADAVARTEARELTEVSLGYTAEIDYSPGTSPEGERYDAVQTAIRINHAAIGPPGWGRSGPEVAMRMDGAASQIVTNGKPIPVTPPPAVPRKAAKDQEEEPTVEAPADPQAAFAAQIEAVKQELAKAMAEIARLQALAKAEEDAEPKDEAPMDDEKMDALVEARMKLLQDAREILGGNVPLPKGQRAIQELVLKHFSPEGQFDCLSDHDVGQMFGGTLLAYRARNDKLGQLHQAAQDAAGANENLSANLMAGAQEYFRKHSGVQK